MENKHTQQVDFSNPNADKITSGTTNKPLENKQITAIEWLEQEFIALQNYGMNELGLFAKAKEMEQHQFKKMTEAFIKNREQTRPLVFENGFFEGFEYALKSAEDYYDKLAKTKFADDDFTREYLQEKSNEIYNKIK
jgi:hypothetical protein